MKLLLSSIILIIGFTAAAQEQVTISGKLIDEQTNKPLEFASVSLLNPTDSALVAGDVTTASGSFNVQVKPGNYIVKMQFIAYVPTFRRIDASEGNVNLGTVSLIQDVATLSEVVVSGQRGQMQLELDKRVFNVAENINNIGANASQILDNLPSISVDVDGNVALRGSQNVRILINGKPSGLAGISGTDALRQLQGNLIERIEVVTNPSARYDAEGSAGIINIVLKNARQEGFNGAFTINTGWPHDHGISLNGNYRKSWFNLFLNYGISYDENPGGGFTNQRFSYTDHPVYNDTIYYTNSDRDRLRGGISNTIRFGSEFFINDKNTLTASFLTRISDEKNISNLTYRDISQDMMLVNFTEREQEELEDDDNYEYQLSYKRTFDSKGQELNADLQYRINDETEDADIVEVDLLNENTIINRQRSLNIEGNTNLRFDLNYVHPFSEGQKFEAGYRGNRQEINSDYTVETYNPDIWEWETDLSLTNQFLYDEEIHAGYAIYENKMDTWGFQLGLRAEYTNIDIYQRETKESNNKNYINYFPSAYVSYNLSDQNSIQASYSRRLSRPRFWYLNPFYSISDNRNYRTGNIDLNPEFTDSYELGVLTNKENSSLYFGAFYRHTTDVIERISYDERINDTLTYTFTIPVNLSNENSYGLEANFTYDPTDWWSINGNANFYRAITKGSYNRVNPDSANSDIKYFLIDLSRDTYTANFRLNSRFKLGKYNIQLSGRYDAPENDTQGRRKAIYTADFGVNREIFNNKGTLTLSVRDLFNSRRYRGITETENRYQVSEFQWRTRQVNLSFTYRINQKNRQEKNSQRGNGEYEGGGEDMDF